MLTRLYQEDSKPFIIQRIYIIIIIIEIASGAYISNQFSISLQLIMSSVNFRILLGCFLII